MAARMIFVKHQSDHVTQCLSSALGINSKLLTMVYRALSKPAPASPSAVTYLPMGHLLQLQTSSVYFTNSSPPQTLTCAVLSAWNSLFLAFCNLVVFLTF